MINQEAILNKIERRQLNWYEHILKMNQKKLTKKVITRSKKELEKKN